MGVQSVVKTWPVLVHTHHLLHLFKTGVGGHYVKKRQAILLYNSYTTKISSLNFAKDFVVKLCSHRHFFLTKRSEICWDWESNHISKTDIWNFKEFGTANSSVGGGLDNIQKVCVCVVADISEKKAQEHNFTSEMGNDNKTLYPLLFDRT